jgi:DNA invertase Pin-like site-specific DNA recombinase
MYSEPMSEKKKYLGYVRVSTDKQFIKGAGIEAQIIHLQNEAIRLGVELEIISEGEGKSGKSIANRPALTEALRRLDKKEANGLMVAKLDRLSRGVADFLTILERSRKGNWSLVIGDLAIDTSSPMGEAMATIAATFAQLERSRISERTKDGLAVRKAQGVKLGAPVKMEIKVSNKIKELRNAGLTFQAIADTLTIEGHLPNRGVKWYPSTVSKTLKRVS